MRPFLLRSLIATITTVIRGDHNHKSFMKISPRSISLLTEIFDLKSFSNLCNNFLTLRNKMKKKCILSTLIELT